ncbi:hypothetical protein K474DRAFT_465773 [Panus rudis PR-1116 ss-1]|nr:hypothetical protein K474DRAFT_465773 [Panus rudis PR-1116 ss-1]
MAVVNEDEPSSPVKKADDVITFSPLPVSQSIPIPKSSRPNFRALTEDSDTEEVRRSAFNLRSIPIPITGRPHAHRRGSTSSMMSTDPIPRSLPRSIVDVHMASVSSSPVVPGGFQQGAVVATRERLSDNGSSSSSFGKSREFAMPRRPTDSSSRKMSYDAPVDDSKANAEDSDGLRKELHDLLETPMPSYIDMPRQPNSPETRTARYQISPQSTRPVTRNPSPVSGSSAGTSSSSSNSQGNSYSYHQQSRPQVLSSASAAAQQAREERERRLRESSNSAPQPSPSPYPQPSPTKEYSRDGSSAYYQQPSTRPPYSRRASETGSLRMKSHSGSSTIRFSFSPPSSKFYQPALNSPPLHSIHTLFDDISSDYCYYPYQLPFLRLPAIVELMLAVETHYVHCHLAGTFCQLCSCIVDHDDDPSAARYKRVVNTIQSATKLATLVHRCVPDDPEERRRCQILLLPHL